MNEMSNSENGPKQSADAIKELIIWIGLIRKNIIKLILLSLVGMLLGYTVAIYSTARYKATLKFVMKSDANNGFASSLSNLTSLLGSGSGPGGTSPIERVIELIGSDRIIGNALLRKITLNNKTDLLINHYINLERLREKWVEDTSIVNVTYSEKDNFAGLNFGQRKAIRIVISKITGNNLLNGIVSKSFDKKSGVVVLSVIHTDEQFAIELTNSIYAEIISFYVDQSVATTKHNVEILTFKADSIKTALDQIRRQYAENTDQSLGLLLQKHRVENKSMAIRESMLTLMYAEVQKNLETLKFIEASTVPSFAVIDAPYSPINPSKRSKYQLAMFGLVMPGILFLVLLRAFLFLKKFVQNNHEIIESLKRGD